MPIQFDKNGIITQNLNEILDEREQDLREFYEDDFVISADDPVGNLQLADADRELAIQELVLFIAMQLDPDQATGMWLDFICALNGIERLKPSKTTCYFTINGTAGISKSIGEITLVDTKTDEWLTNSEAFTISSDGTAVAQFKATSYGPLEFQALSDYELKTPSIGITSVVYNQTKAQVTGSYRETDTQLRARRYLLLQGKATSVKKSIESAVKVVQNVQYAKVYENDTRQTVDGIPEKAFETVVSGGDDNLIANAIFTKKPIGIQAYGTTTVDIQDEDGDSVTIGFTRPTAIQCDLEIEYQVANLNEDQSWTDDLKSDLIAYFDGLDIGEDVYVYNMYCILQKYPKILNVTTFQAKKNTEDETKWADKVVIAKREVARLLTDNITLTPSLQV